MIDSLDSSYSDSIGEIEDQITPFEKIFRGQFIQIVQCRNCKFVSQSTQPFKDIIVDITSVNTVQKAVDLYFNTSDVKEYKCRECKVSATATKDIYVHTRSSFGHMCTVDEIHIHWKDIKAH